MLRTNLWPNSHNINMPALSLDYFYDEILVLAHFYSIINDIPIEVTRKFNLSIQVDFQSVFKSHSVVYRLTDTGLCVA